MTLRRSSTTLSVEREVKGPAGLPERVSLSSEFHPEGGGSPEPSPEELRAALSRLREELDEAVGIPAVPPRALEELVETYRPRQRELVTLLQAEGEISPTEANLLLVYLAEGGESGSPGKGAPIPELPRPTDRPIAAMPLENDRTPASPRPIPRLLEEYHIETLKQAGAVRARRQISYEEYMALKRHFSALAPEIGAPGGSEAHPTHRG